MNGDAALEANAVAATILAHRSTRAFRPDPLSPEQLELLLQALQRGPSSSMLQTYTVVLVRDPERKRTLAELCGGQRWIEACPLFVVGCADLARVRDITAQRGHPYRADDLRGLLAATEDLTIALHNASLVAQAAGLGSVMIGGVLNGAREIADLLALPPRVVPLLGLCLGRPAEAPSPLRPRLPRALVVHEERYALTVEQRDALLHEHDRELRARDYYRGRRIPIGAVRAEPPIPDPVPEEAYAWQEHVARKQARLWWRQAGPKLRADLAALGLELHSDEPATP